MSHCLRERSIDHVVLERGTIANSWRTERWDGLRLLTPNWQCHLPGYAYEGDDADDFMSMPEVVSFIENYAVRIAAPVQQHTTVTSVRLGEQGYEVETSKGTWLCDALVVATGACNSAKLPAFAEELPDDLLSLTPMSYQNPAQLPQGRVLIVGASATGLQLSYDIRRAGLPVTISVGQHIRLPRVYRGRDIQWWLHAAGILDERFDAVNDIVRARHLPSPQLVGTRERLTLDLNLLTSMGVDMVGRFAGLHEGMAQFSGGLRNTCTLADLKMNRLLKLLDDWAESSDDHGALEAAERFEATRVQENPPLGVDLTKGDIRTVIWATGYKADYAWMKVPVLDPKGYIRHEGGVVDSPGMYLMGANFLRRRKSSFIHGAGDDAQDLSEHLSKYLESLPSRPL
jgi:putative flavoprotein involved in K+ transport